MGIINQLKSPADVSKLKVEHLEKLSRELRVEILETVAKNGGHLASNLGMVETTVALYHTFDFSKDKLIFDVGHQCYAHKILSGRAEDFKKIRALDGPSGFPDMAESKFDAFGTGHAGTSVAAGLGYCAARDSKKEDYYVITVVGDGALSCGLNLEAITASNNKPVKHIVILNDNGMSISKNANGFYRFISKRTTRRGYVSSRRGIKKLFGDSFIAKALAGVKNTIKRSIVKGNYFENYGYKYVGVVDGHDVKALISTLKNVKFAAKDRAIFLHIKTTKGKGYKKAEENAENYHNVGKNLVCDNGDFARALGKKLNLAISKDKRVVAITAGMKYGTGLSAVESTHPANFFDVGIAEEFAVTYAAGMAAGGLKPVVAVYSTFMQRAYDQILHDVCEQNLPVVFCLDRAGVVGRDGKTHQGVFDLSYLSHMPNMTILAPSTLEEFNGAIDFALRLNSPVAIRYPKNATNKERWYVPYERTLWQQIKFGKDVNVLAVGPRMVDVAEDVAKIKDIGVFNARTVKPLCENTLNSIKNSLIITLEENSVVGGFGSAVREYYAKKGINAKVICLGVEDKFVAHGSIEEQLEANGLCVANVIKLLRERLI